jgi:hypothetical protein
LQHAEAARDQMHEAAAEEGVVRRIKGTLTGGWVQPCSSPAYLAALHCAGRWCRALLGGRLPAACMLVLSAAHGLMRRPIVAQTATRLAPALPCPAGELGRLYEEEHASSHIHARPAGRGPFQFIRDTLLGPPAEERQGGQEHWR